LPRQRSSWWKCTWISSKTHAPGDARFRLTGIHKGANAITERYDRVAQPSHPKVERPATHGKLRYEVLRKTPCSACLASNVSFLFVLAGIPCPL
jgi:hypothetical protein